MAEEVSKPLVLWLDSDVARSARDCRELAKLAKRKGVKVVVSAQIHLEQCRQVRVNARKTGRLFVPSLMGSFLEQLSIHVEPVVFDQAKAERWGELLDQTHPAPDDWRDAKLRAVHGRLPKAELPEASGVPMTTDWLIALEVHEREDFVASNDGGEEWKLLRAMTPPRAMKLATAMAWLESLPDASP